MELGQLKEKIISLLTPSTNNDDLDIYIQLEEQHEVQKTVFEIPNVTEAMLREHIMPFDREEGENIGVVYWIPKNHYLLDYLLLHWRPIETIRTKKNGCALVYNENEVEDAIKNILNGRTNYNK